MDSQQQQQQQQPNVAPAQPQQAYHGVANDSIQPGQQPSNGHGLPPSYDKANHASVIPLNQLGNQPQWIDCPFCRQRTMTTVQREGTSMQILVGALLCLFCVCLTCVPCLAGWFEDTHYRCSNCKNVVAIRRHDGPIEVYGPAMPVYSQYSGIQAPMNAQQSNSQQPSLPQQPRQLLQQHQEQYPMHELQPQIQQQQPVPRPEAKS
ncbi:LPS-induced tumor necrosis factor alpha factor [Metarhizium album ARSEF 1941]|uniref:LPS-induced tumor necrosis factor alpha factor n=1 Tax=Metarhizium album (strain ARSEF 1941) TaxID=1081103 RepID=A0A0B2WXK9_METAS|nr:LPS-induced tumor necrosis factor alpha factor [Metarhizium album ARSEF 1941]KHN98743.1 LPS-induced tumor necrosis factor alpha factor [Metarhizium album ARSEF 1941]